MLSERSQTKKKNNSLFLEGLQNPICYDSNQISSCLGGMKKEIVILQEETSGDEYFHYLDCGGSFKDAYIQENFFFLLLLEYSHFIILCQCLLYSKVNQIYRQIYSIFWIFFPFRSPYSIEQSSLGYTEGSHQLSILYMASLIYLCQS